MSVKRLYFVSLGSNIDPVDNLERGLRVLIETASTLSMSRVVETEAVGVPGGASFLNLAVAFFSRLDAEALKRRLNAIETALGRDRDDPGRGAKSRVLDLDILFHLDGDTTLPAERVPSAPYVRPVALELVEYLGLSCPVPRPRLPSGVGITLGRLRIGETPCTLALDSKGQDVILLGSPQRGSA